VVAGARDVSARKRETQRKTQTSEMTVQAGGATTHSARGSPKTARLQKVTEGESARRSGADAAPPLAEAKLAAPRSRTAIVQRPRILAVLDAADDAALTLVAAPTGYGKTTAVRAWCASRDASLAWVTLDVGDNDPARFWAYVASAVDRVRQGLGRRALQRLSVAEGSMETVVDELMNGIAALGDTLVVVLDDLHTVTDGECVSSLDYAVEHLPANARLIVLTRTDPALRLPQLRARGSLAELRANELAFTAAETRELLVEHAGIPLDAEEVETLRRRTEGWPAALFLAALWLRDVEDPQRAVREFGGNHRFVADYLSSEVIGSLDDDARSFLLRACVLGRFTAELCDGVLGRSDSAAILAELERSNLFVLRLEREGWYRIHSLFAEFAVHELASLEPGAAEEIHQLAAKWLRSRARPVEAIEHASAAGDHELVAQILVEHQVAAYRTGRARTLLRWMRTLPDEQFIEHPELAVGAATVAATIGQTTLEQRRFLQLARRARVEHPERLTPYVGAMEEMVSALTVDGGVTRALVHGRRAVELARAGADDVLVAALGSYARAAYFAGELDQAWTAALRAVEHPDAEHRPPGHCLARSTLALVAIERGQIAAARVQAERAKSIVGRIGISRTWLGANASAALGSVLAHEGAHAEAERELAYAEHFFRDEVATVHHAWLLVLLAGVRCRRGRLDEAEATLRSAQQALAGLADSGRVPSIAAEVERELAVARRRASGGEMLDAPSDAELAVLRLLATDLSAREIGEELFLSPNTIRSHTRALYRKLGVNSRAEAVARAGTLGLLGQAEAPT
jgi:LuxR family transcriptional regulator, maltose regulon positive regulatory protein